MSGKELLEAFDLEGNFLGLKERKECHKNPKIAHRAVHILLFRDEKSLYLQKRSEKKDLYPLCWDTSVGGHLNPGENYIDAGLRECREELGFTPKNLKFLYKYTAFLPQEIEFVETYATFYDGPFNIDKEEVVDVRAFSLDFLFSLKDDQSFSPFFLLELSHLKDFINRGGVLR